MVPKHPHYCYGGISNKLKTLLSALVFLLVVNNLAKFTIKPTCMSNQEMRNHEPITVEEANDKNNTRRNHEHIAVEEGNDKNNTRHNHESIAVEEANDKNNTMRVDFIDFCNVATTHTLSSNTFVTIFVMTRDRVSSLRESLDSYKDTIQSPYEIVILDHNSSYPPMVDYLHELKTKQNISVVPLHEKTWDMALAEARGIIRQYLNHHPHIEFFVFTDPDIAFLRTLPDVLLFYAGLLRSCPKIKSVGPGLQISDIPLRFTKTVFGGRSVYKQHSQFWTSVPNIATWNGAGYHIAKHPIDTTFVMFRRDADFGRHAGPSFRAYAPYAAVHVDWYDDSNNLPADKVYYTERQSGKVNNW